MSKRQEPECCNGPVRVQNLNFTEMLWWNLKTTKQKPQWTWKKNGSKPLHNHERDWWSPAEHHREFCCWWSFSWIQGWNKIFTQLLQLCCMFHTEWPFCSLEVRFELLYILIKSGSFLSCLDPLNPDLTEGVLSLSHNCCSPCPRKTQLSPDLSMCPSN